MRYNCVAYEVYSDREDAIIMNIGTPAAMLVAALVLAPLHARAQQPRNVVLFVPDGLRALLVTATWMRCR